MAYIQKSIKESACIFCNLPKMPDSPENLIVHRGEHVYLILNRYPYTSGHLMAVPFEHQSSLELLDPLTRAEMMELVSQTVQMLRTIYRPQGFNLGINIGDAAGAGIADHIHFHIVPRWYGDTNFMSAVGDTRILPEALEQTYWRVKDAWNNA